MWTQSEDAHQATHNGNNTTISSQAIKRCDAFDEEGGEIKLIIPLIKEVGKLFFFTLNTNCHLIKFCPIEYTILRLFPCYSNCMIKDNRHINAIRRKS